MGDAQAGAGVGRPRRRTARCCVSRAFASHRSAAARCWGAGAGLDMAVRIGLVVGQAGWNRRPKCAAQEGGGGPGREGGRRREVEARGGWVLSRFRCRGDLGLVGGGGRQGGNQMHMTRTCLGENKNMARHRRVALAWPSRGRLPSRREQAGGQAALVRLMPGTGGCTTPESTGTSVRAVRRAGRGRHDTAARTAASCRPAQPVTAHCAAGRRGRGRCDVGIAARQSPRGRESPPHNAPASLLLFLGGCASGRTRGTSPVAGARDGSRARGPLSLTT